MVKVTYLVASLFSSYIYIYIHKIPDGRQNIEIMLYVFIIGQFHINLYTCHMYTFMLIDARELAQALSIWFSCYIRFKMAANRPILP